MSILSPEDHRFFRENGYVVVPNAAPKENCHALIAAIFEFLGMSPDDPEDWYRPPLPRGGMVEFYQHQAMWDNRQSPRLYQAFAELLGNERLWVTIDRVNFKPPAHPDHPEYDFKGFVHWDTDTTQRPLVKGRRVQGVLYLADTTVEQGGFQCVPEIYRNLEEYLAAQPEDRSPHQPDLTGYEPTPVPGRAGDLLIWDVLLPHGNGHNTSDRPRFAQFISMHPAREDDLEYRQRRVEQWAHHRPPGTKTFPGDPRKAEEEFGKRAELTPLGRKLLGLDSWG
jgi:hypothetical protein